MKKTFFKKKKNKSVHAQHYSDILLTNFSREANYFHVVQYPK